MRWSEAIDRIRGFTTRPTNRDAAGLILFARAASRRYAQRYGLVEFDWAGFALPLFGVEDPADRFVVNSQQQARPYAAPDELWETLDEIAAQLDDAGQPVEMVTNPQGTDKKFRQLARETYEAVQHATLGAINAAEARKKVDLAKDGAIARAKKSGAAFVFASAAADGSVFTDEFPDVIAANLALDRATDDDQILAAGVWEVATGKRFAQKAGAVDVKVTPEKEATFPAKPVVDAQKKAAKSDGAGLGLLLLLLFLFAEERTRKRR